MIFWIRQVVKVADILGRVVDFCPICRALLPFTVRRIDWEEQEVVIGSFIPWGHSKSLGEFGHDRVCESCGYRCVTDPKDYRVILADKELPPGELEGRTQPGARARHAQRLLLEERVRRNELLAEERNTLLEEPFRLLEAEVRMAKGPGPGPFWRWTPPTLLVIGIGLLVWAPVESIRTEFEVLGTLAIAAAMLAGLVLGIRRVLRPARMRGFVAVGVYPLLGRALAPLKPTPVELSEILKRLSVEPLEIPNWMKVDRLEAEIQVAARNQTRALPPGE